MFRISASALCTVLLLVRAAPAAETPIASIVAVEGDDGRDVTAKIKVVAGSFFRGQEIEIFTSKVKARATLVLPPRVEMLIPGDEVKVTFKFKSGSVKLGTGFISEVGKIKVYDEGQKLLAAAGKGGADKPGPAPAAALPALASCPYTAAQLKQALGLKFEEGKRSESTFPGGKQVDCAYEEASPGFTVLNVGFTVMAAKDFAASMGQLDRVATGNTTPIAGDPDGARWKFDQYQQNRIGLLYDRGGTTRTTINMYGGSFKAKDVQSKLLKLKRVP